MRALSILCFVLGALVAACSRSEPGWVGGSEPAVIDSNWCVTDGRNATTDSRHNVWTFDVDGTGHLTGTIRFLSASRAEFEPHDGGPTIPLRRVSTGGEFDIMSCSF